MLATVALGYVDGIARAASNRGAVAFRGARAPIVGRVSMDLLSVDITDMAQPPQVGDWVELVGDTIGLREAAQAAGTNEYEVLTRLPRHVPRHYTGGAS